MTSATTALFTAYVGIDWADRKHDFCPQVAGSTVVEFGVIEHTPEAIQRWALSLHERFGGPIAVCLETTKGPLVYALQRYAFLVLFRFTQQRWRVTARPLSQVAPRIIHPMPMLHWTCCGAIRNARSRSSRKAQPCACLLRWLRSDVILSTASHAFPIAWSAPSSCTIRKRWTGSNTAIPRCSVTS